MGVGWGGVAADVPIPVLRIDGRRGNVIHFSTAGREEAATVEVLQNQLLNALPGGEKDTDTL